MDKGKECALETSYYDFYFANNIKWNNILKISKINLKLRFLYVNMEKDVCNILYEHFILRIRGFNYEF
ncbi:hypothetical protein COO17_23335 [Bacillus wiedmannii]|uniref:Uncharacterized protein n=1 Tax=Bacillus wiedmannii TaxID=1890302 RepID=A0A2A8AX89_9BACI|nr:hypothetical protein TU62_14405 [Bacillus cereus]PDY37423.1 hypothetical protein COO17_23335 [Bacillus wiedmannii]PEJ05403.1 hypothetical protein CN684_20675 [Bacillus wiedmannii]PEM32570.1 hypothetical protein CN617_01700 [Bacillus wiedmannii]PFZ94919.1 hypothetical protein COL83_11565 [Bacillus wiedmannii]